MQAYSDRQETLRRAKFVPPLLGCRWPPADGVAPLARATSPRCTPLLVGERPAAITVGESREITL